MNVVAAPDGSKVIDFELVELPTGALRLGVACHVREFVRIARLPGGGESRDIWRLGPIRIKLWSPRVSPAEVRLRCRISREIPICNSMWYVPWRHWTVARWGAGAPATRESCNRLLARFPGLRDLHPGNVVMGRGGPVVVDFGVDSECHHEPSHCREPRSVTNTLCIAFPRRRQPPAEC